MPDLCGFDQMAGLIISAGFYNMEDLADASTSERAQLYGALSGGRPGWPRMLRDMLGARAPPTDVEVAKAPPPKEVDICAALQANKMLRGIGELLRPPR